MRKLIHSKFELDLTRFKISDTEENNWFSDSFFTKYSFPFEIDLTTDLDVCLGFISFYNSSPQTYYELLYVHNNKIEKAVFEIESVQLKITGVLRFGFEQLPSFEKLLSELSLDKFVLPPGVSIYDHAQSVITQSWPAVNYNFPQIHLEKYETTDELWSGFEGVLNNRVDGVFLTNSVDIIEDITYNKNVMQPLPYWIHILQRGMIDAGYQLSGKILEDPRLQKACLYGDVDYFSRPSSLQEIQISQASEDRVEINYNNRKKAKAAVYFSKTTLVDQGKYNIFGTIKALRFANFLTYFIIKYRNTTLYRQFSFNTGIFQGSDFRNYDIDLDFETIPDGKPNEIIIEGYQYYTEEEQIIDLTISVIRLNNSSGVAIPTVSNENTVDLTRAVPAVTFQDFIKVIKNWFNYDLVIEGKLAIMNPIEDEINYKDALDLQFTEVKNPLRKFNQGASFLLKFADTDNENYKYLPVYQSKDAILNSNYITNEKTIPIEINALPLPVITRKGVQTAFALEQNDSKIYLVKYDGIYNGNNLAQPNDEYLIPAIHSRYWTKWMNFRINSVPFSWSFKAWNENLIDLKVKAKIFAYKKYHIIKTLNKTEIMPNLFDVEIETQDLE